MRRPSILPWVNKDGTQEYGTPEATHRRYAGGIWEIGQVPGLE
ncbi:hypothetical protein [Candidatus Symbiobacter mobilis]|nr:hypothetical protein [Candidatus Symbiobacter mobilis]